MADLVLSITAGLHIPFQRRTGQCLGASCSDYFFRGQGSCLTLANCLPKDLNKAWGQGLHSLMPTSFLPKVSSALYSPVSFSLPNVTLHYFVLLCPWAKHHHNFQARVCVSDITLPTVPASALPLHLHCVSMAPVCVVAVSCSPL